MKIAEIQLSYKGTGQKRLKISNSEEVYSVLLQNWNQSTLELQEEFKVILLNTANEILGIYPLSKGGISQTIVDVKLIFSVALISKANSIIIGHNHPSGNINPSQADKLITNKILQAGKLLDISLLDHIIIAKNKYYSFLDANLLNLG